MKHLHPDGTVHHSLLKQMEKSPAHYLQACIDEASGRRKATRAMNVGTVAHAVILGKREKQRLVVYEGKRQGNAWKDFAEENAGADIVTCAEWNDAELVAQAVLEDPVAGPLLQGARFEVPLRWNDGGFPCSTGGVDVVGRRFIGDLKFTNSAEPMRFQRHAINMLWPAQMAFYEAAARANQLDTSMGVILIAAECNPPYPVTVHPLLRDVLDYGRNLYTRWLDRLRACVESDTWPGYASDVVPFGLPPWLEKDTEGYVDEDAEVA